MNQNGMADDGDSEGTPDPLTTFNEYRSLLFSIAYRMLGTVADAEDVLQDAFIRWQQAPRDEIRSPKAFLVTIVSRLCINHLQSARAQREEYVGQWLPEPVVTDAASDPDERNLGGRVDLHGIPRAAGASESHRAGRISAP